MGIWKCVPHPKLHLERRQMEWSQQNRQRSPTRSPARRPNLSRETSINIQLSCHALPQIPIPFQPTSAPFISRFQVGVAVSKSRGNIDDVRQYLDNACLDAEEDVFSCTMLGGKRKMRRNRAGHHVSEGRKKVGHPSARTDALDQQRGHRNSTSRLSSYPPSIPPRLQFVRPVVVSYCPAHQYHSTDH